MALTVRFTPIALKDLDSAHEYISLDRARAAKEILHKILEAIDRLRTFPDSGRIGRVKDGRELYVATTPFFIVYRIRGSTLDVLAVLHSSRKWP